MPGLPCYFVLKKYRYNKLKYGLNKRKYGLNKPFTALNMDVCSVLI